MYSKILHELFLLKELRPFVVSVVAPKPTISHLLVFRVSLFKDSHCGTSITFFSKSSPDFFPEQKKLVSTA